MVKRDKIIAALDSYLEVSRFEDFAPQGLQVEGAEDVKKIITGVSIGMEFMLGALEAGAQMIMVHHGLFWKGRSPVLKGPIKDRVALLLDHDLTLLAYHLPLDAHPVVGNNAQIIKLLGAKRKEGQI